MMHPARLYAKTKTRDTRYQQSYSLIFARVTGLYRAADVDEEPEK